MDLTSEIFDGEGRPSIRWRRAFEIVIGSVFFAWIVAVVDLVRRPFELVLGWAEGSISMLEELIGAVLMVEPLEAAVDGSLGALSLLGPAAPLGAVALITVGMILAMLIIDRLSGALRGGIGP